MCMFIREETYDPMEKAIKRSEMYWFIFWLGRNIDRGIFYCKS